MTTSGAAGKAAALSRGKANRTVGKPAEQIAPAAVTAGPDPTSAAPGGADPARLPPGQGRRGHLRKVTVELTPHAHAELKSFLLTAFSSEAKAGPLVRALLAEVYTNPALTDRVRRRIEEERGRPLT